MCAHARMSVRASAYLRMCACAQLRMCASVHAWGPRGAPLFGHPRGLARLRNHWHCGRGACVEADVALAHAGRGPNMVCDDGVPGLPSRHAARRRLLAMAPDTGSRPGVGLRMWREHHVLRPDGPGNAFCARCGRCAQSAVTLERCRCGATGRWPSHMESAVRAGCLGRGSGRVGGGGQGRGRGRVLGISWNSACPSTPYELCQKSRCLSSCGLALRGSVDESPIFCR